MRTLILKITFHRHRFAQGVLLSTLFSFLFFGSSFAQLSDDPRKYPHEQMISAISDQGEILLRSGETVRLRDIVFPSALTGNRDDDGPTITQLRAWLTNQEVILHWPESSQIRDRYGRLRAHLERRSDGLEVATALLSQGLAIAYGSPRSRLTDLAPLLAAEDQARENGRGLWKTPRLLDPAQVPPNSPHLVIIEGLVHSTSTNRTEVSYINFGSDWRHDVTFGLTAPMVKALDRQGTPLSTLPGMMVRGRGWVRSYNGPFMDITPLSHLEILPP